MYFVGNDPGENADRVAGITPGGRVLPRESQPSPWQGLRVALAERLLLYDMLEFGVLAKLEQESPDADSKVIPNGNRIPDDDRKEQGWRLSETLLGLMRDYCAAHGIRFMIVGIPTMQQVLRDVNEPSPLADIGQRISVPTVDLLGPFQETGQDLRDRLYFPKNQHWTPTGHELASRIVAAELRRQHLVPE